MFLVALSLPVCRTQPPRPAFDVGSVKLDQSLSLRHVILPPWAAVSALETRPTGDCIGPNAIPTPPEKGQRPLAPCGDLQVAAENGHMYLEGRQITMADAGKTLSAIFDRAIVDKTGFTGKFDAVLRFTPDDLTPGPANHQASTMRPRRFWPPFRSSSA